MSLKFLVNKIIATFHPAQAYFLSKRGLGLESNNKSRRFKPLIN